MAREPKMHYRVLWHSWRGDPIIGPSCGAESIRTTDDRRAVTCQNCRYTVQFIAQAGVPENAPAVAPEERLSFEVTDDVKVALKVINKIATRYANRANLCSQYDQFVEAVNRQLPEGAHLAGRFQHFKITAVKDGHVLETEVQANSIGEARNNSAHWLASPFLRGYIIESVEEIDA